MSDRIDEIRARLEAGCQGNAWTVPNCDYKDADIELLVNAPDDLRWLLDEVERLSITADADAHEIGLLRVEVKQLRGNNGE